VQLQLVFYPYLIKSDRGIGIFLNQGLLGHNFQVVFLFYLIHNISLGGVKLTMERGSFESIYYKLSGKVDVLISVIMPLYNSADYIKKAIDSVLKQSLKNIEVLLVNDG
jgi:hypothetical protein